MTQETLRLAGIEEESIVDGPGIRYVLFTQGCRHNCKGCHNPQTHPFSGGTLYHLDSLLAAYKENPLLAGMTFSGGEPFEQALALSHLAKAVHKLGGNIITYTGYTYEKLLTLCQKNKSIKDLLDETDLLIDGPYIENLRDLELEFRGSSNQRILSKKDREKIDEQFHRSMSNTK